MSLPADGSALSLEQDRRASAAWRPRMAQWRSRLDASLAGSLPGTAVLGGWVALTVAGMFFVAHFGLQSPYADEWRWTAQLVGAAPVDVAWLCQAENGHRAPLFKLVYLAVMRAGGCDFRSGAVVSMALLAGASLAALGVARRLRGRWEWTDLVLPALLLNWSQAINLVWGFQLFYVLPTSLVLLFLLIVCRCGDHLPLRAGVALLVIVWCLPGCGGPGICCLPPLALWLAFAAAGRCTTGPLRHRVAGAGTCFAAMLSLVTLPVYFSAALGGAPAAPGAPPLDVWRVVVSAVQVLSMGMGRLAEDLWPFSGLAVMACAAFLGVRLTGIARRERSERVAALGLTAVILAVMMLAAGIGATRWHLGDDYCLTRRYTTLSAPLLVALYLAAVRYGRARLRPSTQFALALVVLAVVVAYQRNGWRHSADLAARVDRLERRAREGLPPAALAVQCSADAHCQGARLEECLGWLREAGIGPYRAAGSAAAREE